jgi:hypothetical protein
MKNSDSKRIVYRTEGKSGHCNERGGSYFGFVYEAETTKASPSLSELQRHRWRSPARIASAGSGGCDRLPLRDRLKWGAGMAKAERLEARMAEAVDIPVAALFRKERRLRPGFLATPPARAERSEVQSSRNPADLQEGFWIEPALRFKRKPHARDIAVVAQNIDLS